MPELKDSPTLQDIQRYVIDLERERGFSKDTVLQKCLLIGEEMGELFKAIRKVEKMKLDSKGTYPSIEEELADVLIYLSAIANRYQIDLEAAFRAKEAVNKTRQWK